MYIDVKLNNKKTRILVESKYNVNLKNELKAAGARWDGCNWSMTYDRYKDLGNVLGKFADDDLSDKLLILHDFCVLVKMDDVANEYTHRGATPKGIGVEQTGDRKEERNAKLLKLSDELHHPDIIHKAKTQKIGGHRYVDSLLDVFYELQDKLEKEIYSKYF